MSDFWNGKQFKERGTYVYALIRLSDGHAKIGSTVELNTRLNAHRKAQGAIQFLGALPGYRELEREFHERWARYQVCRVYEVTWATSSYIRRVKTDWFYPVPPLLTWIHETFEPPIVTPVVQKQPSSKKIPLSERTREHRRAAIMMLLPPTRLRDERSAA